MTRQHSKCYSHSKSTEIRISLFVCIIKTTITSTVLIPRDERSNVLNIDLLAYLLSQEVFQIITHSTEMFPMQEQVMVIFLS